MTEKMIDGLYQQFTEIIKILDAKNEVSLRSTTQDNFRKTLLLATASYFEYKITTDMISFFEANSNDKKLGAELIKNKAIKRQYHTFFNWEATNANQFFGLFGKSFAKFMETEIKTNDKLNESIIAFIQLGENRNRLVHGNYVGFSLEKTADEIYESYKKASYFVDVFPEKLAMYSKMP